MENTNALSKYAAKRIRTGKTAKDKRTGAHAARFYNRTKPIRQTSSYKLGGQDNRTETFWGG